MRSIRASECGGAHVSNFRGIAGEQPDVGDVVGFDLRQDLRHAVDIGLAADEPDIGKSLCLGDQMFAAAEPDLQPDIADRPVEQFGEFRRLRTVRTFNVERQPRQQLLDQVELMHPQFMALATAEEPAIRVGFFAIQNRADLDIARGVAHRSV